ncbi:MATE family efflux transporter [Blautia wexlerae]|nr:MATE family efflux transporter [Blautia wexlerae]
MTTSMIKGNPLKLMLQFAFPLLLGNLSQQTYNIIDAAIVGQILGAKALASVGASSSIQFLVLGFCMGSCTGFGVPVAKYFGAEKIEKMRDYIFNGAVLCAGIAVILTALCSVLCPQILHILSVPEDIYDNAYSYLLIIFLGIPFTILYNYLSSILRSVGDSRTPFIFLALSAVLNIFLDLFCIVVLKLGCAGARHCNHFRTGNQWNLVLYFYYPQNETSVAQERKQDNKRGCSKGTSGNGNAYGTSVLHHSYRKYGYAVCEQRAWKYICISFYCEQ